jgi:hypothetical protein
MVLSAEEPEAICSEPCAGLEVLLPVVETKEPSSPVGVERRSTGVERKTPWPIGDRLLLAIIERHPGWAK